MGKWHDYVEPGEVPSGDMDDLIEPGTDVPLYLIPEPEFRIPRAFVPMFGARPGWSPDRENQEVGKCDICGYGLPDDPIRHGSRLVCIGCDRSGFDGLIKSIADFEPPADLVPTRPTSKPIKKPAKFKPKG